MIFRDNGASAKLLQSRIARNPIAQIGGGEAIYPPKRRIAIGSEPILLLTTYDLPIHDLQIYELPLTRWPRVSIFILEQIKY